MGIIANWKCLEKHGRTVEDTGNVTGLVVGDCRGDNSTDAYFQQMNISRKGYDKENLVTQAQCEGNHKTTSSNYLYEELIKADGICRFRRFFLYFKIKTTNLT